MAKHKSVAQRERRQKKKELEEEHLKCYSELDQDEGVSWNDLMAFNKQNLVYLGWKPDEQDDEEEVKLVRDTSGGEEATGENVQIQETAYVYN